MQQVVPGSWASPTPWWTPSRPSASSPHSRAGTGDARRHVGCRRPRQVARRARARRWRSRSRSSSASTGRRERPGPSCSCPRASSPRRCGTTSPPIAKAKGLKRRGRLRRHRRQRAGEGRRRRAHPVATPGRLHDLVERGVIELGGVADLRAGRGRPHARHGLPAAGRPHRAPPAEGSPDDVLLGHARRRRRADRRRVHARPGPPRGRSATADGRRGRPPLRRRSTPTTRWTS